MYIRGEWFGIAMDNFHQLLSACHMSIFLFPDDNLSKYQLIFTDLGMFIETMEIWFETANGQISSIFDRVICPPHIRIFTS